MFACCIAASDVSLPLGCYHLHPMSQFVIITQPEGWYSLYHPTEGRRLSWPNWTQQRINMSIKTQRATTRSRTLR